MTRQEMFALIGRVQNGFLIHATPEQMREQLRSEGIPEEDINSALVQGEKLAEVRLSPKCTCAEILGLPHPEPCRKHG